MIKSGKVYEEKFSNTVQNDPSDTIKYRTGDKPNAVKRIVKFENHLKTFSLPLAV
jgi:hypothetical protein